MHNPKGTRNSIPSHRYRLRYRLEPGYFSVADARGNGLTDAIVILSILFPSDGSYSLMPITLDGRNGKQLPRHEQFKAWALWGARIAEIFPQEDARHKTAKAGVELLRAAIRNWE